MEESNEEKSPPLHAVANDKTEKHNSPASNEKYFTFIFLTSFILSFQTAYHNSTLNYFMREEIQNDRRYHNHCETCH